MSVSAETVLTRHVLRPEGLAVQRAVGDWACLLGICFWRKGLEERVSAELMGEKGG